MVGNIRLDLENLSNLSTNEIRKTLLMFYSDVPHAFLQISALGTYLFFRSITQAYNITRPRKQRNCACADAENPLRERAISTLNAPADRIVPCK